MKRLLYLFAIPLLLVACAPDAQQRADFAAVQSSGVSPAIYDKMFHDDPLSVGDIAALGHARVNEAVIIRYIRAHGTVYYLAPQDIDYLQKAGVSQSVIDYMVQTAPAGAPYPSPNVNVGIMFGPYWHHWR